MDKKSPPKLMKDLGEFGFIREVRRRVPNNQAVLRGIGDDTAILRFDGKKDILYTTDMILEDRHFRLGHASAFQIGYKAMAVNISDIAAMAGIPTHAVVSVGLPAEYPLREARQIYRGLLAAAKPFGVSIVGGDTNRSDKITLCVTLLGEVEKGQAVLRSGAKEADVIFVTGRLGGSYASGKHLMFVPRVKEARFLAGEFDIHAMMDISDGLCSDLKRMAEESGVGAVISSEMVPCNTGVSVEQALTDGEDFELLFTLSPHEAVRLSLSSEAVKTGLYQPIGKITARKKGIHFIDSLGKKILETRKGFDHFL